MNNIVLIVHNIRSCHNVGSLLRTSEGLKVDRVYFTGYTPYPIHSSDERLPHIANKTNKKIVKTSLGAEKSVNWLYFKDVYELISSLKLELYSIVALEQAKFSTLLPSWIPKSKIALIVGSEIEGVEHDVLSLCDLCLEIPMYGKKESFNVAVAAAMALYHCRFN